MSPKESINSSDAKDLLDLIDKSDPDSAYEIAFLIIAMAQNG